MDKTWRSVTPGNPVPSLFPWIEEFTDKKAPFVQFHAIVQRYGDIFKGRRPTPEEEQQHFLYYYGSVPAIDGGETGKSFFMEKSSPEWISTALCLFAVSAKYVAMTTKDPHHSHAGMNEWVKSYSLEKQARECKRFLNGVKEPAKNPFNISEDHRQAFDILFRGICQHCPDMKSSSRKKAKEPVGDTTKPGCLAALHFVKGITAVVISLEVLHIKAVEYFNAAREKEHGYFFWWYNLLLREKYLSDFMGQTNKTTCTSMTEGGEKAHDLAPDSMKLRTGLCKLLVDLDIAELEGRSFWETPHSRDTLRNLLKTANAEPSDPSELHQKWARIKVAELTIRNASTPTEKKEGRELLHKCLSISPLCHLTLGALGILFQTEDPSASEELLSKAKQICPSANIADIFDFTGNGPDVKRRASRGEATTPDGKIDNTADPQFGSGTQTLVTDSTVSPPPQTPERSNSGEKGKATTSGGKGRKKVSAAMESPTGNQMGSIEPDDRQLLISTCPIECPPVWLAKDVARIREFSVQKAGSLSAYLQSKLDSKEFRMPQYQPSDKTQQDDTDDDDDGQDSEENPFSSSGTDNQCGISAITDIWYAAKISVASLAFYLNKTELSTATLANFEEAFGDSVETTSRPHRNRTAHHKAYKYLLDSTKLCVAFLKKKSDCQPAKMESALAEMQIRWLSIKSSSIVNLIKGRIADQLGLAHDISLDQYRKAAVTEPNYFLWQKILYEKLGQMRKSGTNSHYPISDEVEACQRAHQLSPKNPACIIDLAGLQMQRILRDFKGKKGKPSSGYTSELQDVLHMLKKAQEMAHPKSRQEMTALLKIAELYTAKGLPQRVEEAEEIFKKCLATWPENSMVLHKTGKFYQNSRNDYRRAGEYYEKAIKVQPQNYPCLMDLVRLNGRCLQRYDVVVTLIDASLSHIRNPEHVVAMLIIKGQACWFHHGRRSGMKEKACQAWLEVFKNYPQLAFKVEEALRSSFSATFGHLKIPLTKVSPVFANVVRESGLANNKTVSNFVRILGESGGVRTLFFDDDDGYYL